MDHSPAGEGRLMATKTSTMSTGDETDIDPEFLSEIVNALLYRTERWRRVVDQYARYANGAGYSFLFDGCAIFRRYEAESGKFWEIGGAICLMTKRQEEDLQSAIRHFEGWERAQEKEKRAADLASSIARAQRILRQERPEPNEPTPAAKRGLWGRG